MKTTHLRIYLSVLWNGKVFNFTVEPDQPISHGYEKPFCWVGRLERENLKIDIEIPQNNIQGNPNRDFYLNPRILETREEILDMITNALNREFN